MPWAGFKIEYKILILLQYSPYHFVPKNRPSMNFPAMGQFGDGEERPSRSVIARSVSDEAIHLRIRGVGDSLRDGQFPRRGDGLLRFARNDGAQVCAIRRPEALTL